jgi:hypothetical protein
LNIFAADNCAKWVLKMNVLFMFHKIDRSPMKTSLCSALALILGPLRTLGP